MSRESEFLSSTGRPDYSDRGAVGTSDGITWRSVSLAERREGIKGEPGSKWGPDVALVPTHKLLGYREYNRLGAQNMGDSDSRIDSIASDLRSKGAEGMREPVYLIYSHEQKWGFLGEGHHRVEAALRAGVSHVPVRVLKGSSEEVASRKKFYQGAALHLDNRVVETGGYMPSYMHPGNFQEFEGHR